MKKSSSLSEIKSTLLTVVQNSEMNGCTSTFVFPNIIQLIFSLKITKKTKQTF